MQHQLNHDASDGLWKAQNPRMNGWGSEKSKKDRPVCFRRVFIHLYTSVMCVNGDVTTTMMMGLCQPWSDYVLV
jgi:hypothetical protein